MMNKQAAKEVCEFVLKASGDLDESVAFVRDNCSEAEFVAYRESIGKVMNDLWLMILKPIYNEHPDLEPEELR
jgi:hypothetical protein